jgi:hypothetical protein
VRAFWSYNKEIARQLYNCKDDDYLKYISITNLVKCNNAMGDEGRNPDGSATDKTTHTMKNNCMNILQVFWREVSILKPKNIVIYSHYHYDNFLDNIPIIQITKEKTSKQYKRKNGKKEIYWWDREGVLRGSSVRILRTSHPERQKKDDFVKKIIDWIRE